MSPPLAPLLLAGFMTLGGGLILLASFLMLRQRALAQGAGGGYPQLRQPRTAPSPGNSFAQRLLQARAPEAQDDLKRTLMQAGFPSPSAPYYLALAKLGLGGVFALLGVVALLILPISAGMSLGMKSLAVLMCFLIGYVIPGLIVQKRAEAYVDRISKGLPDALDLMLVCVESGQSIDQALRRVTRAMWHIHPDLAAQLSITSEALKAGADRAGAFERLAYATSNADIKAFAAVLMQAAIMGTSVAQTLRVYAADQRDRRVRRVEERANMLPTKMTLGTMMLTVPPLLLLLLTPAIYKISQSF